MARGESNFHIEMFLFVFCCLSSTQPFSLLYHLPSCSIARQFRKFQGLISHLARIAGQNSNSNIKNRNIIFK